ncbi:MAG: glycosyltransferase [Candidatus Aegiribacteria sp.]|nr:glycosyltransferase [Candidatus Aegiribacteria sp.]MBD3294564.1 glycosyltransferase [Candidatus Fermentibacteria bacterium]
MIVYYCTPQVRSKYIKPNRESGGLLKKALIVIPTYNEVDNISNLIPVLLDLPIEPDILVVDDSSPDGTGEAVKSFGDTGRVHLLVRPEKKGLGQAYIDGFRWALEHRGFDPIVQMDADFSHKPEKVPELVAALEDHDLAIGSRYCSGVNVVNWPLSRLLLSWFANRYTKIVTGLPVEDATGGFKAFRREALNKLDLTSIKSDGYSFQIEVTYKLYKEGCTIKEVPIIFVDRHAGTSKMTKTIVWEAVWMVWHLRFPWLF